MDEKQFQTVVSQQKAKQPPETPKQLGSLLKEIISGSKCEKCGIRTKYRDKNWCIRCIKVYIRCAEIKLNPKKAIEKLVDLVGEDYVDADLDLVDEKCLVLLLTHRDIFLWGNVGAGKSYAMAAVIKRYIFEGYTCERINFDDFCSRVRSTMNNNSKLTEDGLVQQLVEADKLFIDDIGLRSKKESEFAYITFYRILNRRQERLLQTFITTNKSIEQLALAFDSRIASRLSIAVNIHMTGKDRRKEVRNE